MNNDIYRDRLKVSLAVKARMNAGQVNVALKEFDNLAKVRGDETAFKVILNEFGNEDVLTALAGIREELERANLITIDVNPITRLRKYIDRVNKSLEKMQVEITGIDEGSLTEHQKLSLQSARRERKLFKIKMPAFVRALDHEKQYCALAEYDGKTVKLELEIKY